MKIVGLSPFMSINELN